MHLFDKIVKYVTRNFIIMDKCRTCLKTPADKDISQLEKGIDEHNKNQPDIMRFCLDIKVAQDSKITTKLCIDCYRKIISFYKFKVVSLKNDAYLKSLDPEVSKVDEKLSVYVDENGIKHENVLDTDEYGASVVKDGNTKIKIEISIKSEDLLDVGSGEERQSDVKSVKNEDFKDKSSKNAADDMKTHCAQEYENIPQNTKENGKKKETLPLHKKPSGRPKKRPSPNITQERQVCEECGISVLNLKLHSLQHQPRDVRQLLQCKACPKQFLSKGGRYRHYQTRHLGVKSKCDICNKEVVHLATHKLQVHNQEAAPFGCVSCERRFVSQSALDMHMLSHTKDRAFECDVCHGRFRSKGFVSKHIRQVHTKERNHQCEICSKAFFDKSLLQEHLGTHATERVTCTDCGKSFTTKASLRKHRILHNDVWKHSCSLCNKRFKLHRYLTSHMLTHTKEKAYPCQYCGARFGRAYNRRLHELKHQKDNNG